MRFPPEFIERVKQHLPLSEVIGRRMPIRRHGREFQGLCPFHKEKSPSFTVNDEKGFFHCFGCGAHGDAIGFIKDYDGIEYKEAVERLAGEAGLEVPKMSAETQAQEQRRLTLVEANARAAEWFARQLRESGGREGREYLHQRGLSPDIVQRFGLGYAAPQRDALKQALIKEGFEERVLVEAGLIARTEDGQTYDRFRGRLVFPIRDAKGRTVAFGGRLMPSQSAANAAKYLNSPETPLFKKGEMLYAYDIARKAAHDAGTLLIAEGYMDVIALHQAGFAASVAPLGTAVTEAQLALCWRAAAEPVFCLDGDAAGKRAMLRAGELALPLLAPGFSLRFALLPPGEDPDSLIQHQGPGAMQAIIARAELLSQVLWAAGKAKFNGATAEARAALEHHLMGQGARIQNPVVRQHMRDYFKAQLNPRFKKGKKGNTEAYIAVPGHLPDAGDGPAQRLRLEERMMGLVLLHPDILHQNAIETQFGQLEFSQQGLDKLQSFALEESAGTPSLDGAGLCSALAARGYGEKVETILHSTKTALSPALLAGISENPRLAAHAFEQAHSAYRLLKLEDEMKRAARALEADMSEPCYQQFLALQQEMETLKRARNALSDDLQP